EVDSLELEARAAAGGDVAVDESAVRHDQEDPPRDRAVLARRLADDAPVEHGLVEGDREGVLRAETDRVRDLGRILDAGELEEADADPVVGDAETDAGAGQLVLLEEATQGQCEPLGIAYLAAADDAVRERRLGELEELGGAAGVRDMGG